MRRIYGDGRHHLMEASPRSTPAHPFTLPSNELRHSRTKFDRSSLSLSLFHVSLFPFSLSSLFPLPSFSLVSPVHQSVGSPSLRSYISVFVALPSRDSRASFAGTAFLYLCRICLSVHAFTDLHLRNTARSFHASPSLLYCISVLVVPSFSFAWSSFFVSFFAAHILDPYSSIKSLLNCLKFFSYVC